MTRPVLWVTMGVPGAGKSTWSRRSGLPVVSLDWLRRDRELAASDVVPWAQRRVAETLAAGESCVVDGCNTLARHRAVWLAMARRTDAEARLVCVPCSPAVAWSRQARRPEGQRVPRQVIARYAQQYAAALPLLAREGWHSIEVVADGGERTCAQAPGAAP